MERKRLPDNKDDRENTGEDNWNRQIFTKPRNPLISYVIELFKMWFEYAFSSWNNENEPKCNEFYDSSSCCSPTSNVT